MTSRFDFGWAVTRPPGPFSGLLAGSVSQTLHRVTWCCKGKKINPKPNQIGQKLTNQNWKIAFGTVSVTGLVKTGSKALARPVGGYWSTGGCQRLLQLKWGSLVAEPALATVFSDWGREKGVVLVKKQPKREPDTDKRQATTALRTR